MTVAAIISSSLDPSSTATKDLVIPDVFSSENQGTGESIRKIKSVSIFGPLVDF